MEPTITVIVNGLQTIECAIPKGSSDESCVVRQPAMRRLRHLDDVGRFELHLAVFSSVPRAPEGSAAVVVEFAFDDHDFVYAGPVVTRDDGTHALAFYCDNEPLEFAVRVRRLLSAAPPPHPEEAIAVEMVRCAILAAPHGSVGRLRSVVDELHDVPAVSRVVAAPPYSGRWSAFFAAHGEAWRVRNGDEAASATIELTPNAMRGPVPFYAEAAMLHCPHQFMSGYRPPTAPIIVAASEAAPPDRASLTGSSTAGLSSLDLRGEGFDNSATASGGIVGAAAAPFSSTFHSYDPHPPPPPNPPHHDLTTVRGQALPAAESRGEGLAGQAAREFSAARGGCAVLAATGSGAHGPVDWPEAAARASAPHPAQADHLAAPAAFAPSDSTHSIHPPSPALAPASDPAASSTGSTVSSTSSAAALHAPCDAVDDALIAEVARLLTAAEPHGDGVPLSEVEAALQDHADLAPLLRVRARELLDALRQFPERFWVRGDEWHTTRVGLARPARPSESTSSASSGSAASTAGSHPRERTRSTTISSFSAEEREASD